MKKPMRRNGANDTSRETVHCWGCPGWTFNAGKVCTRCLDAGLHPVPPDLRRVARPAVLNQALKAARSRLKIDEFKRHLARIAVEKGAAPC